MNLTKKKVPFRWEDEEKEAFQKLKDIVISEPVLRELDLERPFEVETDALNVGRRAILFQRDKKGKIHPIVFMSVA